MEHVLHGLLSLINPGVDADRIHAAQRAHIATLQHRIDAQQLAERRAAEARHRELVARALGVKVGLR